MARTINKRQRANGEGSVFQRSDGRWVAQIAYVDDAGKIRKRMVYKKTEEEAWQHLNVYLLYVRLEQQRPGKILLEKYMKPRNLTQYRLAKAMGVPQMRISDIVRGKRAISPDTALRLAYFFGTDEYFWAELQARYDVERVKREQEGE